MQALGKMNFQRREFYKKKTEVQLHSAEVHQRIKILKAEKGKRWADVLTDPVRHII